MKIVSISSFWALVAIVAFALVANMKADNAGLEPANYERNNCDCELQNTCYCCAETRLREGTVKGCISATLNPFDAVYKVVPKLAQSTLMEQTISAKTKERVCDPFTAYVNTTEVRACLYTRYIKLDLKAPVSCLSIDVTSPQQTAALNFPCLQYKDGQLGTNSTTRVITKKLKKLVKATGIKKLFKGLKKIF